MCRWGLLSVDVNPALGPDSQNRPSLALPDFAAPIRGREVGVGGCFHICVQATAQRQQCDHGSGNCLLGKGGVHPQYAGELVACDERLLPQICVEFFCSGVVPVRVPMRARVAGAELAS